MRYTFTGAFAPHICGLIEKKQALGYDYHGSACILQTFDKFCRGVSHEMGREVQDRAKSVQIE